MDMNRRTWVSFKGFILEEGDRERATKGFTSTGRERKVYHDGKSSWTEGATGN
jgi:hypothetical protein